MSVWRRIHGGVAVPAVFTLALGIAASTAMFGVFDAVLLAPVPFAYSEKVVAIQTRWTESGRVIPRVSGGDFMELLQAADVFAAAARYHGGEVGVQLRARAEWAGCYWVSPGFFQVFDAGPIRGRAFTVGDENRSVVVSAAFANRALGGTERALGQTVHIDTRPYQVVGVMPPGFAVPARAEIWVASAILPENRSTAYNYYAVARLKPGVSGAAARQRLIALARQTAGQHPENRDKILTSIPLRDSMVGSVRPTLVLLMASVTLVLLIACTNVAHLMVARAAARSREFAVRAALGAGVRRIALQVLGESAATGLSGGLAGALLAYGGVRAAVALAPANLPRIAEARVDGRVLLFALAAGLVASLLFGLAPVWQALRTDVQESLKSSAGRGLAGGRATRLRDGLVACEIALSFTLAAGAGLLVRSMVELNAAALGFRTEGILVIYAHSPANTMLRLRASTRFFETALSELRQLQGVQSAAAAMGLPTGRYGSSGKYAIDGEDYRRPGFRDSAPDAGFRLASPAYFATLGIPLTAGRDFSAADQYDAPFVAIISQSLARRSFPNQDPIGRKILCSMDSDRWMTIIGVAGDVRSSGPAQAPGPELYMPFPQHPVMANELQLVVRAAGGGTPTALADAVVRKMRELNPEIALQTTTLDTMVYEAAATPRFRTFLVTVFAGISLLLAMAGVYGVVAYMVAQRTGELGLRMALGCTPSGMMGLVVGRAARLALTGLAAGALLSAVALRFIGSMLFGASVTDADGYLAAAAAIGAITLAAASVPALRAVRIDPAAALRRE